MTQSFKKLTSHQPSIQSQKLLLYKIQRDYSPRHKPEKYNFGKYLTTENKSLYSALEKLKQSNEITKGQLDKITQTYKNILENEHPIVSSWWKAVITDSLTEFNNQIYACATRRSNEGDTILVELTGEKSYIFRSDHNGRSFTLLNKNISDKENIQLKANKLQINKSKLDAVLRYLAANNIPEIRILASSDKTDDISISFELPSNIKKDFIKKIKKINSPSYPSVLTNNGLSEKKITGPRAATVFKDISEQNPSLAKNGISVFERYALFHHRKFNMDDINRLKKDLNKQNDLRKEDRKYVKSSALRITQNIIDKMSQEARHEYFMCLANNMRIVPELYYTKNNGAKYQIGSDGYDACKQLTIFKPGNKEETAVLLNQIITRLEIYAYSDSNVEYCDDINSLKQKLSYEKINTREFSNRLLSGCYFYEANKNLLQINANHSFIQFSCNAIGDGYNYRYSQCEDKTSILTKDYPRAKFHISLPNDNDLTENDFNEDDYMVDNEDIGPRGKAFNLVQNILIDNNVATFKVVRDYVTMRPPQQGKEVTVYVYSKDPVFDDKHEKHQERLIYWQNIMQEIVNTLAANNIPQGLQANGDPYCDNNLKGEREIANTTQIAYRYEKNPPKNGEIDPLSQINIEPPTVNNNLTM